jgi:hypothetical protein
MLAAREGGVGSAADWRATETRVPARTVRNVVKATMIDSKCAGSRE